MNDPFWFRWPFSNATIDDYPHLWKSSEDPGQFMFEIRKASSNDPVLFFLSVIDE